MHVVVVDTTLTTPPTGGGQTFLVHLAGSLVKRGYSFSVITQPGPEMAVVSALRLAGSEVHLNLWSSSHLPEEKAARLAEWVNTHDVSVYIVSISPDAGWLALPLLNPTIATLTIAHNDVGAFYDPVAHYAPLIDCAIGVSLETERQLLETAHLPPDRVRYIPYGIEALPQADVERRLDTSAAILRIGYIGRLVEAQKRVMDFVDLIRELRKREIAFELHLVGEGQDRVKLEHALKENGFAEDVTLWGWLTPDQVRERLTTLDVFILLSDHEGLPVALLEAMGQTLAPVVTRINSGNSQLIRDGENGLLFPVGETVACADHLARLANDQNLLRVLRQAAWETAREYSVERMVDAYEQCFRSVAAAGFSNAHRAAAPQPYPLLPACRSRYPFWLRKVKSRLGVR
jgi:glycosyltransferase involved in cell wall biosynthesis